MHESLSHSLQSAKRPARVLVLWLVLAAAVGLVCGGVGTAFHLSVEAVTELRGEHGWILWLLPLAGLVIVVLYKGTRCEGMGTNNVIRAVQSGEAVSPLLVPAIFLGTVLTHLCGGSAGREGAALQMGGSIGYNVGRLFHLSDHDRRTATVCGMAAFFSALFGTPLAATMFAIMVISVGNFYHTAFIPCFAASLVSYGISMWLGVAPTRFAVAVPSLAPANLLEVAVLAALCAWVSAIFCKLLNFTERRAAKLIPNAWLRAAVGGFAIIALTLICGTTDYNGAGMDVITAAVEQGTAKPEAFIMKILFTVITLSAGFKGGEVVPSFFIGATFGCAAAPLLGLPAGFGAALGLVSVFCGATNCPMASIFLSIELFGGSGVLYFALACGVSYMLSGYNGLYSSQTILYSKLKAQYINVHTNAYHAGGSEENLPHVKGSLKE